MAKQLTLWWGYNGARWKGVLGCVSGDVTHPLSRRIFRQLIPDRFPLRLSCGQWTEGSVAFQGVVLDCTCKCLLAPRAFDSCRKSYSPSYRSRGLHAQGEHCSATTPEGHAALAHGYSGGGAVSMAKSWATRGIQEIVVHTLDLDMLAEVDFLQHK